MKNNPPPAHQQNPNMLGAAVDLLSVGGIYVVTQIVVAILLILLGFDDIDRISEKPGLLLIAYTIASLVTLTLTVLLMHFRTISVKILQFKKFHIKDLGYALWGYVIYIVLTLSAMWLLGLIPGVDPYQDQDLGLQSVTKSLLPLTFLAIVVMPPIAEEILFRGYLYGRLKFHRFSLIVSALVTSAVFGLVHGQINVGVDTFILSMVMIYMLEKRHSLWVTMIMHFIKNLVAFLALFVFKIV